MNTHRLIAAAAGLATVAAAATPALAGSPAIVSKPTVIKAPAVSPLDIAGAKPKVRAGKALAKGYVLERYDVSLPAGTGKAKLVARCPAGKNLVGLGARDISRVGFKVTGRIPYAGRRAVGVTALSRAARSGAAQGAIYALCR